MATNTSKINLSSNIDVIQSYFLKCHTTFSNLTVCHTHINAQLV